MHVGAGTIRIAQFSDTHFVEAGTAAEGGFGYDIAQAFDAVHADYKARAPVDMVVVTGDVADHGRTAQYAVAAAAFERLDAPVHVCPGNHDQHDPFTASLGRAQVTTSRAIEAQNWCFLFVDSNDGIRSLDETGRAVDPPDYEDRLHCDGSLGEREAAWVRAMCAATNAEHVFVWLHHPPACEVPFMRNEPYTAEWQTLLDELPIIRGLGGGHTHIPADWELAGRPIYVAPSLKNNFDLDAKTMLGPGYRTYAFTPDGTVTSEVHLIEDERWPRAPLGRALLSLFNADLTFDEFYAIVGRKTAGG